MITPYKHYFYDSGTKNFRVALYARLSREDDKEDDEKGKKDVSESIQNQVEFLEQIILQNGWTLVDKYVDDGISGTTFARKDFKRMIADIEAGKVNMVITKDLSRLGRDYIQTGYYLENYFPSKNVRYIAVNDGFDTFEEASSNDFIPFKSVFNDMYAKDISKKVRTALKTKQIAGSYLGTSAPFGYQKDPAQKGHLLPDPVSSGYVKRIFEKYLAGVPLQAIATQLTQEGIPTPSQYSGVGPTQTRFPGVWNDRAVRVILKNEVYIGHTAQNKYKKVNYKLDKQVGLPPSQWIKVENTHEPTVALEDFQAVQALMAKRSCPREQRPVHLFTGFVFCGRCGAPYSHMNQHQKGKYYLICGTAKRHRKLGLCSTLMIKEEVLLAHVLALLRDIAEQYIDPDKLLSSTHTEMLEKAVGEKKKEISRLQAKIEEAKHLAMNLYKDKINGAITEDMFKEFVAQINDEREGANKQLIATEDEIRTLTQRTANDGQIRQMLQDFLKFPEIDRTTLSMLVRKIIINHDNTIEVQLTFQEPVHSNFVR